MARKVVDITGRLPRRPTKRRIEGVMRVIPAGYRIEEENGGFVPYAPDGTRIMGTWEHELSALRVCEAHEAGEIGGRS
jgi:hypothetical protein